MNKLLGKSKLFKQDHYSWKRHEGYVSTAFMKDLFDFAAKYDHVVKDDTNFSQWKADLETRTHKRKIYYYDFGDSRYMMCSTEFILKAIYKRNGSKELQKIGNVINGLNEIRLIEMPEQTEDIIWCAKIAEQLKVTGSKVVIPGMAYNLVVKELKKVYTDEEIEAQFAKYTSPTAAEIFHFNVDKAANAYKTVKLDDGIVAKIFTNCYEFDINAAYFSALMEIFPKAKDNFNYWYINRHKNNNFYKKVVNYFVGNLTINDKKVEFASENRLKMLHDETRNWIVNYVNSKLKQAIRDCQGSLVYANTDGFIISNPKNIISYSKNIGDFGLEAKGMVYTIKVDKTENRSQYTAFQFEDNLNKRSYIKGTLPVVLRDKLNIPMGKYPTYKIVKQKYEILGFDNLKQEQGKKVLITF